MVTPRSEARAQPARMGLPTTAPLRAACAGPIASPKYTAQWLTGWFVYFPAMFCGVCVVSKRLHDRGRSGWWAALVLTTVVALWPRPGGLFGPFFLLAGVWAVVELCVMAGEQGANRYGPNPLAEAVGA